MNRADKTRTGMRRLAREITLRILFQYEVSENLSPEETFALFCSNFGPGHDDEMTLDCDDPRFEQALPFFRDLFFGVTKNLKDLDKVLEEASDNWRLYRMSRVDRNVMRLALYEMLYRADIPPKVSINEAIDLGKSFGTEESGAFINGVLDKIHHKMQRGEITEKS